ncbi:MAG: hypothetical protein PWP34_713 [Desulfuromonadales bacterium]|jgi:hypothetical protein|nr:hypothetical protein [Desulfuromonadales bacterium]
MFEKAPGKHSEFYLKPTTKGGLKAAPERLRP